jgi:hypothetical protein
MRIRRKVSSALACALLMILGCHTKTFAPVSPNSTKIDTMKDHGEFTETSKSVHIGQQIRQKSSDQPGKPNTDNNENSRPPFSIELSLEGLPKRNATRVKTVVTNNGESPITWDNEFSTYVVWEVRDSEGRQPQIKDLGSIPRQETWEAKRFVVLKPGERTSRIVDLTDSVRHFKTGVATIPTGGAQFMWSEDYVKYVIAPETLSVVVRLQYNGNIPLQAVFGRDAKHLCFWEGRTQSNELLIRFE